MKHPHIKDWVVLLIILTMLAFAFWLVPDTPTEFAVEVTVTPIMSEDELIERMCATDPDPEWCIAYQKKLREDPELDMPYYVGPDGYEEE